jgi:hypothetical protein
MAIGSFLGLADRINPNLTAAGHTSASSSGG